MCLSINQSQKLNMESKKQVVEWNSECETMYAKILK